MATTAAARTVLIATALFMILAIPDRASGQSPENTLRPAAVWSVEFGSSLLLPENPYYRRIFSHGGNLQLSVDRCRSGRHCAGIKYRLSIKQAKLDGGHKAYTHFLGTSFGPHVRLSPRTSLSFAGTAYYVYVWERVTAHEGYYPPVRPGTARSESGFGLGADVALSRRLSDQTAAGIEIEYNFTWLARFSDSEYGNVGGLWLGLFFRALL